MCMFLKSVWAKVWLYVAFLKKKKEKKSKDFYYVLCTV